MWVESEENKMNRIRRFAQLGTLIGTIICMIPAVVSIMSIDAKYESTEAIVVEDIDEVSSTVTTTSTTTSTTTTTSTSTTTSTTTTDTTTSSTTETTTTAVPTQPIQTEPIVITSLEIITTVESVVITEPQTVVETTTVAVVSDVIETESVVTTEAPALTLLGTYRGTYYRGDTNPCRGGSGQTLIDCAYGSGGIKGSIACKYIYANYGYNINGRTKVYLESDAYPSLNGWYYVDDCCASYSVIDFYYPNYGNCPFRRDGVISVRMYI